ncbi:MAG: hypothetical protein WC459_02350 [Patescibacteria group bacterium]
MLFTTHAITGATIGILSGNPLLGFGLGVLSHHILDAIPHFDQGSLYIDKDRGPIWLGAKYEEKQKFKVRRDWIILFADWAVSGAIFLYLLIRLPISFWPLLICGGIGGLLTDILDVSPFWKNKFRATRFGKLYHKLHNFLHWPLSGKLWYLGLTIQIAIVATGLALIRKFLV